MPYPTRKLINEAFYISGVLSSDLETMSASQLSEGLGLLNDLLAIKSVDKKKIPYYNELIMEFEPTVPNYFIENLVEISTVTFNMGEVRFPMEWVPRETFFGDGRVNNINSLPFTYHSERALGGSNLYVYYRPEQNYTFTIWGKFSLPSVTRDEDLETIFDRYYIVYLRYALAEYICNYYVLNFSSQNVDKLKELEANITTVSPYDFTNKKISGFVGSGGLNYGDINFGRGYRPYNS